MVPAKDRLAAYPASYTYRGQHPFPVAPFQRTEDWELKVLGESIKVPINAFMLLQMTP